MKHFDGERWKEHIEKKVRPDFEHFGKAVLNRILPVFDTVNQEATDLEKHLYEDYKETISTAYVPDGYDVGQADEALRDLAFGEAFDHAVALSSIRQGMLNLCAAALYHLTEQHVVDLRFEIRDYRAEREREEVSPDAAIKWFNSEVGLDLKKCPTWPLINELRLVANVVKHAEGYSAEQLRNVNPELFQIPDFRNSGIGAAPLRVRRPLSGQDIYVSRDDFVRYHAGSVQFWTEVAIAVGPKSF